jgi:hypothetical protein
MKSLLILAVLAVSSSAFSSEALLQLTRHSGFAPKPFSSTLSVYETGKVELIITRGNNDITTTELKDLSPNTIQSIKDNIEAVKVKAPLVDLEESKPRCTDAPSSEIKITKNKKEVLIGYYASCHKSEMKSKPAASLIKTIQSIDLSRTK